MKTKQILKLWDLKYMWEGRVINLVLHCSARDLLKTIRAEAIPLDSVLAIKLHNL